MTDKKSQKKFIKAYWCRELKVATTGCGWALSCEPIRTKFYLVSSNVLVKCHIKEQLRILRRYQCIFGDMNIAGLDLHMGSSRMKLSFIER